MAARPTERRWSCLAPRAPAAQNFRRPGQARPRRERVLDQRSLALPAAFMLKAHLGWVAEKTTMIGAKNFTPETLENAQAELGRRAFAAGLTLLAAGRDGVHAPPSSSSP